MVMIIRIDFPITALGRLRKRAVSKMHIHYPTVGPLRQPVWIYFPFDLVLLFFGPGRFWVFGRRRAFGSGVNHFEHTFLPLADLTRMIDEISIFIIPERSQGGIKLLFGHDISDLFLVQGSCLLNGLLEMLQR